MNQTKVSNHHTYFTMGFQAVQAAIWNMVTGGNIPGARLPYSGVETKFSPWAL